MIELKRIKNADDPLLAALLELYQEAFPAAERRDEPQLKRLIVQNDQMFFHAVISDGELVGLFVYWDFEEFFYLEHLAVYASMRNRRIGGQILEFIAREMKGLWLLEVEPAVDEMTIRRVAYYERNGYQVLDKTYTQPAYDKDVDAGSLWIMGNARPERLPEYIEKIKTGVYRAHYDI